MDKKTFAFCGANTRFKDRLQKRACVFIKPTLECKKLKREKKIDSSTGRVRVTSSYVTICRKEEMKNYRVSDFCMENLIMIGADKTLNTTSLTGSSMSIADNIDNIINSK